LMSSCLGSVAPPPPRPSMARLPNLPVLFTSGYSESAGSSRVQLPSSRYLQKP
jgi:hypothetical protein